MEKFVKYPVDMAGFKGIREDDYLYVDKTEYVHKLSLTGKYYFLARPRRFGKSLFLDTLAEYFKGNRALFKGLAIERLQPEEWESYPVLRFNLTGSSFLKETHLLDLLSTELEIIERNYGFEKSEKNISDRFYNLIVSIYEKTGKKIVILIDEYDAPLSSTIDKPELQQIYREELHGFYSVLKKAEEYIRFCMLTGVTRYGKVSVFSGLNNLNDITFDNSYAGICGITKEELMLNYIIGIEKLAQKEDISPEEAIDLLKFNYDGYHFSESMVDIYNPFSINYAMYHSSIDDYWCQSGTPTLLAKTLMQNDYDIAELNGRQVDKEALSDLSVFATNPIPLFYQTGYMTLKAYDPRRKRFTIGYPNREVESGILNNILKAYVPKHDDPRGFVYNMEDCFEDGNPERFIGELNSFLAGIPAKLKVHVDRYENYFHTIFYSLVSLIGLDVQAEYATSEGYIDILIKTDKYIYIIELKVNGTAEDAIKQIEERHYCAPFESDPRKIYCIGLGFSKETGTITSSEIKRK